MSLPVTVVTVAFGSPDVVEHWAEKWSGTGASCIVSNNGPEKLTETMSQVKILPYTGNYGFGAGINRAVEAAENQVILITNPDTLPMNSDSLENLFAYHTHGSVTGAATFDSANREVHSTGLFPEKAWVRSQVFKAAGSLWSKESFDWIQGSLMMLHRQDFLRIGGFSSRYPLYFEDVDFCFRAKMLGMIINQSRGSHFIHDEGSGSEKASATRLSCFHWGLWEFFRDHDPRNADSVRRMLIAKCILRIAFKSLVDIQAAKGYSLALRSLVTGVAPELPGSANG